MSPPPTTNSNTGPQPPQQLHKSPRNQPSTTAGAIHRILHIPTHPVSVDPRTSRYLGQNLAGSVGVSVAEEVEAYPSEHFHVSYLVFVLTPSVRPLWNERATEPTPDVVRRRGSRRRPLSGWTASSLTASLLVAVLLRLLRWSGRRGGGDAGRGHGVGHAAHCRRDLLRTNRGNRGSRRYRVPVTSAIRASEADVGSTTRSPARAGTCPRRARSRRCSRVIPAGPTTRSACPRWRRGRTSRPESRHRWAG